MNLYLNSFKEEWMREKQLVFPVQEMVQHEEADYSQHITVTLMSKNNRMNRNPEFSLCGVRTRP